MKEDWAHAISLGSLAVEPLCAVIKGSSSEVRKAAAEALGRIGDAGAAEPLCTILGDSQWDVHRTAMEALGRIGNARAVEPLCIALRDGDSDVRQVAAEALAWACRLAGRKCGQAGFEGLTEEESYEKILDFLPLQR